jgi:hypothetical protein
MRVTNSQGVPINDYLWDDMLLKVTDSNPWYANIVAYMVIGYVPPGAGRKRLIHESRRHMWDDPYLYRVCSDGLWEDLYPVSEGLQIIEKFHAGPYGGHYGVFWTH